MLGASKSIWGFDPRSIPGCTLWLDGADNATMDSTSAVTVWNDKSGQSNTMTGTGTWSGGTMVFNGTTNAFSNTAYVFPFGAYSMFAVYSNTTAPAAAAYMNAVYGSNGFPMLGTFGSSKFVSARSVVANTGALVANVAASSNVLVSATYTPSTFSPFVNGTAATTLAGTTLTTTGLFLGGPSNYFNGSISELLIFGTTLANAQRQSVEGYLSRKWGIGSRLLSTHPFYTIPPFNRYFNPTDIPGCSLWLDGADNSSMNSTTTVTSWSDKSGLNNTMTGTATWTGSNMSFNGSTQAFSNTAYVFPASNYSMFAVYSNTTAPAADAYMNAVYGSNGFPMLGTFGPSRFASARSVVANTGALGGLSEPLGWAARISGTNNDTGRAIATDTLGNVFVCGDYGNPLTAFNQGPSGTAGTTLPFTGGSDCFVAKYSSAGAVMWAARIASISNDFGYGIATDTSGNVVVTGYYNNAEVTLYNQGPSGSIGTTLPSIGFIDCFVAKYSSEGAVLWAARIGNSTNNDIGNAIATDTSGNVLVTGSYGGILTIYNQGPSGTVGNTLSNAGGSDCFVAKYSSAGAVLWAARIAGTGAAGDVGYGIATDTSGNVLVTGSYVSTLTIYNQGPSGTAGTTLSFIGGTDCFIAKYSSAGAVLWAARIADFGRDTGYAIATDTSGNVFVCGEFEETVNIYNQGPTGSVGATISSSATAAFNVFIAKYSSVGAVLWAAQISGTNTGINETGRAIATDPSGNVIVTGQYNSALTIISQGATSSTTLLYTGTTDVYVAKYSSAGTVLWATRIAGQGASLEAAYGIATDTSGNVLVTGQYPGTVNIYNQGPTGGVGIQLPAAAGDCYIVKYTSDGLVTGPTPASSNVLVSATYTPSTFSPFVNGSTATTLAGTTLATTGIYVGGPSNYFNGTISELLIYSSTLTSNQRQQVEGYLINKWRLSAQTLSNHPYKLIPPATSQPAQFSEVTPGNWTRDWRPQLLSLAAANASGVTVTTSNLTGGVTYVSQGWLGGVLGPDGNIYFAPYNSANILKLTVSTGVTTTLTGGATYTLSGWTGGVLGPDGNIYFAPYNAPNILRLNVSTGVTTNITGGAVYSTALSQGCVIGPDGNMYCVPYNVARILKLDISTGVTSSITGGATYTSFGWVGATVGPDGNIYFTPSSATNILRLNVFTGVTTNITGGAVFPGNNSWRGGGVVGLDGNIYFPPWNAANILRFNVSTGVTTNITGGATYTSGGWNSGVLGPDGNIYFAPYNATNILRLNVSTGVTTNITGGATFTAAGWAGGGILALDGNVYVSPFSATNILKLTFSGLSQLPSSNYVLSAYANKY